MSRVLARGRDKATDLIRLIHEKGGMANVLPSNEENHDRTAISQPSLRPPMRWLGPGTSARLKPSGALLGFDRQIHQQGMPSKKPRNYRVCEELDYFYKATLRNDKSEIKKKKKANDASLIVRRQLHETIFALAKKYRDAGQPRRSWATLIERHLKRQDTPLSAHQIRTVVTGFETSGRLQAS